MYKAIIFDLDGTLLDTITDISDSVNAVLKSMNYHTFSVDEYKYLVGKGVDELISKVISKGELDPDLFFEMKSRYLEEYAIRKTNKTKPYPGIVELLKGLKEQNVLICVLSNKPHYQTTEVVQRYFGNIDFDYVMGKKPEYPIKPNPMSVNHLIQKLQVPKEEILYVGDTSTDMETASNAKLTSVGVLWGFREQQELEESGAQYIVKNTDELLTIIVGD